jgi:hypothetical protein
VTCFLFMVAVDEDTKILMSLMPYADYTPMWFVGGERSRLLTRLAPREGA